MRERLTHPRPIDGPRYRASIRQHVRLVLREWHRRHADVVALLEKQQRTAATGIGDAEAEGGAADARAARHFTLPLPLELLEHRFDHRVFQAEAPCDVEAGQIGAEVQQLERQRGQRSFTQASFVEGPWRARMQRHRGVGGAGRHRGLENLCRIHWSPPLVAICATCRSRAVASCIDGRAVRASSNACAARA